jgi:hypothetical protein
MSSLVGNVVSNKCCLCVENLLSQLTCLYVLYAVNPPPPLAAIHIAHESSDNFLCKKSKCWVNYQYSINQLLHSVAKALQWCSGTEQG